MCTTCDKLAAIIDLPFAKFSDRLLVLCVEIGQDLMEAGAPKDQAVDAAMNYLTNAFHKYCQRHPDLKASEIEKATMNLGRKLAAIRESGLN
jgi:hypothetical protein